MQASTPDSNRSLRWELGVLALTLGALFFQLRDFLLTGTITISHDNYYWEYPAFHYLAENLLQGNYPFWNPFTHGGEPFYPLLSQVRLLEPLTLVGIGILRFFTQDTLVMFNWIRVSIALMLAFGIYLCLRPWARHTLTRISLIPILILTSFTLSPFRQDGLLHLFMWTPFTAYFLQRIFFFDDRRWQNWLGLALSLGLNWQSYMFAGALTFLAFFGVGMLLFHRDRLKTLFTDKGTFAKIGVVAGINLLMMAPNITLLKEKDRFAFGARMAPQNFEESAPLGRPFPFEAPPEAGSQPLMLPYSIIQYSGSFSNIWNFVQMIIPEGNLSIQGLFFEFGKPAETYMYLGTLTFLIGLLGIFLVNHLLRRFWLFLLISFGLLLLGPAGGLHEWLYRVFPPFWFFRHTQNLAMFFQFCFLFFYVIGLDALVDRITATAPLALKPQLRPTVILGLFFLSILYLLTSLEYPEVNQSYLWIGITAGLIWMGRRTFGAREIFWGLLSGIVAFVWISHPNAIRISLYFYWALLLPMGAYLISLRITSPERSFLRGMASLFMLAVGVELAFAMNLSWLVFSWPNPKEHAPVTTHVKSHYELTERKLSPAYAIQTGAEGIRYLPLLYRKFFAFSSMHDYSPVPTAADVLAHPRWNSFMLLKEYSRLVFSKIDPRILESLFRIRKSPVYFVQQVKSVPSGQLYESIRSEDPQKVLKDTESSVYIEGMLPSELHGFQSPVENPSDFSYTVSGFDTNSLSLETRASGAGILVWADGFDPSWNATLNGKTATIYRVNGNFKGVLLPPGVSEVKFEYRPLAYLYALRIFYLTFLSVASLALALSLRSRAPLGLKIAIPSIART